MADLEALTEDGRTPLLCCVNGDGSFAVAKLLLEAGCNKDALNKNNLSALSVRASGQDELEDLLRSYEVVAESKLTNWREAKKAVKKIAAVSAFTSLTSGSEGAAEEPLSPS